jgi:hypothetical protein
VTNQVTSPAPARTYHVGHERRTCMLLLWTPLLVLYKSSSLRLRLLHVPCAIQMHYTDRRQTPHHCTYQLMCIRVVLKTLTTRRKPVAAFLTTISGKKPSRHQPRRQHDHISVSTHRGHNYKVYENMKIWSIGCVDVSLLEGVWASLYRPRWNRGQEITTSSIRASFYGHHRIKLTLHRWWRS